MKYEIEVYKGQTIFYDEHYDKFVCDISVEDNSKSAKRGSLADLRKEIDTFVKNNLEFKPFKVFKVKYSNMEQAEVTAIRTDGKFVVKTGGSKYTSIIPAKELEEDYRAFDQSVADEIAEAKAEYNEAENTYRTKKKAAEEKLKTLDVSQYKMTLV